MYRSMVPDRDSVQLTSDPRAVSPPSFDRDSIFGDTYDGVPNPQIPFQHPYPTRYHGPVWTMAQPGHVYAERPYASAPFLGLGADISGDAAPLIGGGLVAAAGALVGWLVAPRRDKAPVYAAVGAVVGIFLYPVFGMLAFAATPMKDEGGGWVLNG